MREIWKDVRVGARLFRRSPGLAASVAITIGVGIGASLAIFGLLHDALIGQSPFRDPDRLIIVENTGRYYYGGTFSEGVANPAVSWPDYTDIEAQRRTLAAIGALAESHSILSGGDRPRPVARTLVSPGLFAAIQARPQLGRLLDAQDFKPGADAAAVLSQSMWRRHFGSDPSVVGKTIRLDDQPFTVVGVMSDSVLRFLRQPQGLLDQVQDRQVVTPLLVAMAGREAGLFKYMQEERDGGCLSVVGRLAPGRTPADAASEIALIGRRLATAHAATNGRRGLQARSLEEWRTTEVRGTTLMLLVAALLVFLVASFNASGLILAESVRRQTETAVRQALGAGPARLIRLEFLRSIVLALPGGVLAVLLAGLTLLAVDRILAGGSGAILRALFVPRVILAGVAITALAGLIAGAGAAWTVRRRNIAEVLKEGGLTASAGTRRQLAMRGLVALQVAAATALVLGAGLMLRSVWNIISVDLGFDVRHSLVVMVNLPQSRYPKGEDQRAFFQRALPRIRALPGVQAAGVAMSAPMTGTSISWSGVVIQLPSGEKRTPEHVDGQAIMPGYLEALDLKLVRGRWFNDNDYASGKAALVDQAFCRKYLAGVDPLQVRLQLDREFIPVVGVVGDVRRDGPLRKPVEMMYVMESFDRPAGWSFFVVRAAGNPSDLAASVLREIRALDATVSTDDPRAVQELFADTFATRRRLLMLLGSAAVIVLLLTAFSLVSALGQFVAARRREIAIRMALGAESHHVTTLLARHVGVALLAGLALGAGAGLALARALSTELFGVKPADPWTFAETLALLALLAALAAIAPVWRASRIDPTTALRVQ